MALDPASLETVFKLAGIILPTVTTVITGGIWVVKRIEKGQNKLWKRYRKLADRHATEMAEVTSHDNKPDLVTLFPNSGMSNSEFAEGWIPSYFEELTGYKVDYQQALNGQDDLVQAILASKEE